MGQGLGWIGFGDCVNRQHGVLYGTVARDWQGMGESGIWDWSIGGLWVYSIK